MHDLSYEHMNNPQLETQFCSKNTTNSLERNTVILKYKAFCMILKSPYHGFLKMTVHVVWTIALRE